MRKEFLLTLIMILARIIYSQNACPDKPTVTYQGKTYNTVQIGSQCWLKENLDVGTMIPGKQSSSNNNIIEKYCYNDSTKNCDTYGGMYTWEEAMTYNLKGGVQGICPSGWHIPEAEEFQSLIDLVHDSSAAIKAIGQGTGPGKGNNRTGFSLLINGYRRNDGTFGYIGVNGTLWSSTEFDQWSIKTINVDNSQYPIYNNGGSPKSFGYAVRCISDDSGSLTILSPNGGEKFLAGTTKTISWTYSWVTNLKIEYSIDDGVNWIVITDNFPAKNGQYSWKIPESPSKTCRLKITSLSNPKVNVISKSTFSIFASNSATITLQTYPSEAGSATGSGYYDLGSTIAVSVNPVVGYAFESWTENGNIVSKDQNYVFVANGNRSLTANLEPTWDTNGKDYTLVDKANVAVILIDFPDTKPAIKKLYPTADEMKRKIFDSTSIIQRYLKAMSYSKFKLTGDVFGPFTHQNTILSDQDLMGNAYLTINSINIPNFQVINYTHFVFIAYNDYINWGGCASAPGITITINGNKVSLPYSFRMASQIGYPNRDTTYAFYNNFTYLHPLQVDLPTLTNNYVNIPNYSKMPSFECGFIHELLHTLGIWQHANSSTNGNNYIFEKEVNNNCHPSFKKSYLNKEYGNNFDIMGDFYFSFSLNGCYRDRLGWLENSAKVKIDSFTKQRVTLYPINRNNGYRSCEIRIPNKYSPIAGSKNQGYYLEIREPDKWDSSLVHSSINKNTQGILLLKTDGLKTYLLDASPSSNISSYGTPMPDLTDIALKPGMRYTDGDVYFSHVEKHNDGAFSLEVEILDSKTFPSKPILRNTLFNSNNATLHWFETPHTIKYFLQISKDPSFTFVAKTDSVTIDTSKAITGLEINTKYYWRVRGKNLAGYGEWSDLSNFNTIIIPTKPILGIQNNSVNQPVTMILKWNKVSYTDKYFIQLSKEQSFAKLEISDSTSTDTSMTVTGLSNKTKYYWRVRAKNLVGYGDWSEVYNFTTIVSIPDKPQLALQNNLTTQPIDMTLRWNKVKDAEKYLMQLSTDEKLTNIVKRDSTIIDTLKVVSSLLEGQKYFWRVQAKNVAGASPWSDTWSFTTLLNKPDNLTITRSGLKETKLTWKDNSNGEAGYIIERKLSPSPTYAIIDSVKENIVTYLDKKVEQGLTYLYRVKGYTKDAISEYSNEANIVVVGIENEGIPTEYSITQNYPNPFNPTTVFRFGVPHESNVTLSIYNILGQQVAELVNDVRAPGYYRVNWDASNYSSGVYIYRIEARPNNGDKSFMQIKKMIYMK